MRNRTAYKNLTSVLAANGVNKVRTEDARIPMPNMNFGLHIVRATPPRRSVKR